MTKFRSIYLFAWIILLAIGAAAQQPLPTPSPTPKKESETKKIEKEIEDVFRIKSRRPSVSNPADFNTPGVLQIEYGYGGYYRGNGFRSQHAGTLTVSFAATERIGLEFDIDTISSEQDRQFFRTTGVGDSRLGVQFDIADESKNSPSFAVSYFAKLPTASAAKNLGTGRVDHIISTLFSKKVGKFDVDFNLGLLINGRQGEKGFVTGGQFAFGISRDITKKFSLQTEIYGESKDSGEPQGLFAAGIADYQLNEKFSLNGGLNFGLTKNSPRIGLVFGVSYKFGTIFKKKH